MATKLKDLWLRAIALVDRGANQESKVVLTKRDDTQKMTEYSSMDECLKVHDEGKCKELMAAMKSGTQSAGTGQTVILDLTKVEDAMSEVKLPEEVQKALAEAADLKKRVEAAEAETKTTRERLAKMEDDQLRNTFIAKAKEFSALPGATPDDLGPILRKAYGIWTADEQKKVEEILRGASKLIQDSPAFTEIGRNSVAAGGDPYAKLTAMANAIVQKDGKLSFEQAMVKVTETPEGRVLFKQHESERDAALRGGRR